MVLIRQMKFLKVGCFRSVDAFQHEMAQALLEFSQQPFVPDGSRLRMVGDVPIILRKTLLQPGGNAYLLDFARIREGKTLPLSDLKGNEGELSFQVHEKRPSDRTAAILDLPSQCLLIQENGSGISHTSVAKYLRQLGSELLPAIRFQLVMDGAAQARMLRSGGFEKLSIGLAKLGNVDDLANFGFSDKEIMKLTSGMAATRLNISFGVERHNTGERLDTEAVISLASSLLNLPGQYLRTLRVTPTDVDEDGLAIDLINDRILVRHPVTVQESEDLADEVRYRAVDTAWRRYRDVLRERFPAQ